MERIRLVMVDDSLLIMVGCPDPKGRGGVKLLDGGWGGNRPQVSCPPRPSLALTCINHMEFCARPREICLLYTSDAADEEDSVDLGGRRIIKKKTQNYK